MKQFANLPLLPSLQTTLVEQGLTAPTEIQARTMPLILEGKSVVGVSETGSGKTLAYALPLLHRLKKIETESTPVTIEGQPRAVVVVPTRELGEQVTKAIKPFIHGTRLRVRSLVGGTTLHKARKKITGPYDVLVATPGRLEQLLDRKKVNLEEVRILVFDEADQLLDQGFLPAARRFAGACPADRQLVLFSATVSTQVQTLIGELWKGAEVIRSKGSHHVVPTLKTENLEVRNGKRFPILEAVLAKRSEGGTLIFTNTRAQCDDLSKELRHAGKTAAIYRGEMDRAERRENLKAFREGKIDLLISTDLASRGLHVEHIGRVINYHLPQHMENYLHRVGRTARAGKSGLVVNLVTERDMPLLDQLDSMSRH